MNGNDHAWQESFPADQIRDVLTAINERSFSRANLSSTWIILEYLLRRSVFTTPDLYGQINDQSARELQDALTELQSAQASPGEGLAHEIDWGRIAKIIMTVIIQILGL